MLDGSVWLKNSPIITSRQQCQRLSGLFIALSMTCQRMDTSNESTRTIAVPKANAPGPIEVT